MQDKQPIIDVQDLKNHLGDTWVHTGLNFSVYEKEIVGIIGGSGSGKTTLIRSILMLLKPTAGNIHVFGVDVTSCSELDAQKIRYRWGVMFQQSALFSSMTLLENVTFPLRIFTTLDPQTQQEIALIKIKLAGLSSDAAHKYPSELSGGMKKRAALARALALDPELLFLDEPTSGLDPRSADEFDELILELRKDLNLTLVIITHDLDSLWNATDSVAFLGDGKVLAQAPMEQLVQAEHPLVQAYLGGPRGQRHR